MSQQRPRDGEDIELSCNFRDLQVTIRGPALQAADLLQRIAEAPHSDRAARSASPSRSDTSYELVAEDRPRDLAVVPAPESRYQIEATFGPCPDQWIAASTRLGGLAALATERIRRAWLAGQWAGAVKSGRIPTPNRTPPLNLRSRCYAVVSAPGIPGSVVYKSSSSYWQAIGQLGDSSISHSFPSELEARVYLSAAGVESFTIEA